MQAPGKVDQYAQAVAGQTFHGDHAYISYQIPADAKPLPLVFWHGIGQFSKTWETTPDGGDGFQNIFLRRKHSGYLINQPRRGRSTAPDNQRWFNTFRVGVWPEFNLGGHKSRLHSIIKATMLRLLLSGSASAALIGECHDPL